MQLQSNLYHSILCGATGLVITEGLQNILIYNKPDKYYCVYHF